MIHRFKCRRTPLVHGSYDNDSTIGKKHTAFAVRGLKCVRRWPKGQFHIKYYDELLANKTLENAFVIIS